MAEAYKKLNEEERKQAGEIWTKVFGGDDSSIDQPGGHTDPWRDRDNVFGCLVDDRVVSVVHLMRREAYVPGGVWTFGAIAGVATLEEFRGRGYSSKVMRMAMDQMHEDRVDIGLLLTGINPFYERLGWITIPRTTFRATIERPLGLTSTAEVSKDIRWQEFAAIYDDFNHDRPFAVRRTPEYWDGWAGAWMRGATRIVVRDGSTPIAYAVARPWNGGVGVPEICWLREHPEAAARIAEELLALTESWKSPWFGTSTPYGEPGFVEALKKHGVTIGTATWTSLMALPITRTADELAEVRRSFDANMGVFWPLDDF